MTTGPMGELQLDLQHTTKDSNRSWVLAEVQIDIRKRMQRRPGLFVTGGHTFWGGKDSHCSKLSRS